MIFLHIGIVLILMAVSIFTYVRRFSLKAIRLVSSFRKMKRNEKNLGTLGKVYISCNATNIFYLFYRY